MPEYRISFTSTSSATVTVEAEDYEAAIDAAYDELPSEVCAQCSGWGQSWGRDDGEWELDESGHYVDGEFVK